MNVPIKRLHVNGPAEPAVDPEVLPLADPLPASLERVLPEFEPVVDPEVLPLADPLGVLGVPDDPAAPLETIPLVAGLPLISTAPLPAVPLPSPVPLETPVDVETPEPLLVPEPEPEEPDCALPLGFEEQPAATSIETRQPRRERLRIRPPKREDFAKYRQWRVNGKAIEKVSSQWKIAGPFAEARFTMPEY